MWREFTLDLESELIIELRSKAGPAGSSSLPIINALEVLRESMQTPGMAGPGPLWLNERNPERTEVLKLSNLRDLPFGGRLEFRVPKGIKVECPAAGKLEMEPGKRLELPVTFIGSDEAPAGPLEVVAALIDGSGATTVKRPISVEWLGKLERQVLRGGTRCVRQEPRQELWNRRMQPNLHWESLDVSRGFRSENDGGAATSYVWFHFPQELRNRDLKNVRLHLHRLPTAARLLSTVSSDVTAGPQPWGAISRLSGPPWPDWNKVNYGNLPRSSGEAVPLAPSGPDPQEVSAAIPGKLAPTDEAPDLYLAIEPSGIPGTTYWTERSPDPRRAPGLVIDYLPAAADN